MSKIVFDEEEKALEKIFPSKDRWLLKMDWNVSLTEKELAKIEFQLRKNKKRGDRSGKV